MKARSAEKPSESRNAVSHIRARQRSAKILWLTHSLYGARLRIAPRQLQPLSVRWCFSDAKPFLWAPVRTRFGVDGIDGGCGADGDGYLWLLWALAKGCGSNCFMNRCHGCNSSRFKHGCRVTTAVDPWRSSMATRFQEAIHYAHHTPLWC